MSGMLPIFAWMLGVLLIITAFAFPARGVGITLASEHAPINRRLFQVSLLCYPVFLLLVEMGHTAAALAGVMGLFLLCWRQVLLSVDWLIIFIFMLMFVDLGLLAQLPFMTQLAQGFIGLPGAEVTGAALLSQMISNVPAAIFLAVFSDQWYWLAWGLNVGGFGLAIGFLANLIALRLSRIRGLWVEFHAWSIPMLLISLLGALMLKRLLD